MDYKSQLNLSCQKRGISMPKFTHESNCDGVYNWRAKLTFDNNDYISSWYSKKIDAENDVAKQIFDRTPPAAITIQKPPTVFNVTSTGGNLILIDLENIKPSKEDIMSLSPNTVIGFCTEFSRKSIRILNEITLQTIICQSAVNEAVDHYMTFYIGLIIGNGSYTKYDKIIIITSDRSVANTCLAAMQLTNVSILYTTNIAEAKI